MRSLHLTIPVQDVQLEARLYCSSASPNDSLSSPSPLQDLDRATLPAITRLVTAAHPWSRLGGNMLFPYVQTSPLTQCAFPPPPDRALVRSSDRRPHVQCPRRGP